LVESSLTHDRIMNWLQFRSLPSSVW